jgi:hypothetical protein
VQLLKHSSVSVSIKSDSRNSILFLECFLAQIRRIFGCAIALTDIDLSLQQPECDSRLGHVGQWYSVTATA